MNVIAVDDELGALERMQRIFSRDARLNVLSAFSNPLEALEFVKQNPDMDVAFLDIEMPGMNGLELASEILKINPSIDIIMITAYQQYALEAFRVHVSGYLLKPIDTEELAKLVDYIEEKRRQIVPVSSSDPKLDIKCFGTFRVHVIGSNTPIRFRTAKAEELFALLVHYEGRSRSKDYLLEALWPDSDVEKALNNFRVTCTYIRNALNDQGFNDILMRDKEDYYLDSSKFTCDVYKFRAYAERIDKLTEEELKDALSLYNGEYLDGKYYYWCEETSKWLHNALARMRYDYSTILISRGEYNAALAIVDSMVDDDPCSEDCFRRLVELYVYTKNPNALKNAYSRFSKNLKEEFGILPAPELKEWAQAQLNSIR